MDEETKEGVVTEETPKETNKTEEPKDDGREEVLLGTGQTLKLNKDEQRYLIQLGVEAYQKSQVKPEEATDKTDDSDKEADVDEKALDKKVDKLLTEFANLRKEQDEERRAQTARQIKAKIESEIDECISGHELTKGDKELAASARSLVINRLVTTQGISVKDAFKQEIKHFENIRSKYIKDKKEDKEKTRGAGKGGGAASGDPEKLTGADFYSGKLRKRVTAKLNKQNRF